MYIVFKLSNNLRDEVYNFYKDSFRNTPPYAVFQAKSGDTIITLYESGKIVFQGKDSYIDANIWIDIEKERNKRDIRAEIKKEEEKKEKKKADEKDDRFRNRSTIGSDEVGTGDYFAPIVVAAAYVSKEDHQMIYDLGIKDSKRITDNKILEIGAKLITKIPYSVEILPNKEYNILNDNIKKILALMHNNALKEITTKYELNYDYIVIDQFAPFYQYYNYLKDEEMVKPVTVVTKGEDKALSVAAASIIARYYFLKEIENIENKYDVFLLKGAGLNVDKLGVELVKKHGVEILDEIAKVKYKNTDKIKEMLD